MSENIIIKKNAEKTFDNTCLAAALSAAKPDDTLVFDGLSLDGKPYGFNANIAVKSRGIYLTIARRAIVNGGDVNAAKNETNNNRTRSGGGKTAAKYPYSLSLVAGSIKIDCNNKMAAVVQPENIVKFNLSNAGAARLMRTFSTDSVRTVLGKLNTRIEYWVFPDGTKIMCGSNESAADALANQTTTMIRNGDIELAQHTLSAGLPEKQSESNDIAKWINDNYPAAK